MWIQVFRPEVDTNVVVIGFDLLKNAMEKLHQGDPIMCKKCDSVLNKYSKVQSGAEYLQKMGNKPVS